MRVDVLDGIGYVELLDYMADDLTPVNAARVSFARESKGMSDHDLDLLNRLMREHHGSPFEHCVFHFRVKAPLFVVAQWERHRMASYNQQSGRYSEFEPEFYTPEIEIALASAFAYQQYHKMLDRGVPKERARIALPVGTLTTFRWTVNARSLMNFISQRNDEHAQEEMQEYALEIEDLFAFVMPATHAAFVRNGRVAP